MNADKLFRIERYVIRQRDEEGCIQQETRFGITNYSEDISFDELVELADLINETVEQEQYIRERMTNKRNHEQ